MYLRLEKGESISFKNVVGVFDIESASTSKDTKAFFRRKEDETGVVTVCDDLPKSFILAENEYGDTIYISGLSSESVRKRTEERGMKTLWKK